MSDRGPELDVTHARQGRRGRHALIILVTSLALVVVAFAVIFALHAGGFSGQTGNREAPADVARSINQQPGTVRETGATAPQGSAVQQAADGRTSSPAG